MIDTVEGISRFKARRKNQIVSWLVFDNLLRRGDVVRDVFNVVASARQRLTGRGRIPTVTALLQKSTNLLDAQTRECSAYLGAFAPKPATFDLAAMKTVWQVETRSSLLANWLDVDCWSRPVQAAFAYAARSIAK